MHDLAIEAVGLASNGFHVGNKRLLTIDNLKRSLPFQRFSRRAIDDICSCEEHFIVQCLWKASVKTQCLRLGDDVLVAALNEAILFVRAWQRDLNRYSQVIVEIVEVVAKSSLSIGMDNNDIELEHTLNTTDECSKPAHHG